IVVTAGMVSTTWVQFIKGGLLVAFCLLITVMILQRGFRVPDTLAVTPVSVEAATRDGRVVRDPDWPDDAWLRVAHEDGSTLTWRRLPDGRVRRTQVVTRTADGRVLVDGLPHGLGQGERDLAPVGAMAELPGGAHDTGALGPLSFLRVFNESTVETWTSEQRTLAG